MLWDGYWNDTCWDLRLSAAVVLEVGDPAVVTDVVVAGAAALENPVQRLANFDLRQAYVERLNSVLGQAGLLLCQLRILHCYRQAFRNQSMHHVLVAETQIGKVNASQEVTREHCPIQTYYHSASDAVGRTAMAMSRQGDLGHLVARSSPLWRTLTVRPRSWDQGSSASS